MSCLPRIKGSFQSFLLTSSFVIGLPFLSTPSFSEGQKGSASDGSSEKTQTSSVPFTLEKEAIPSVKTCPEAGFGFFSLGSNDTCLRVGGLVRGEAGYQQPKHSPRGKEEDAFSTYARGRIEIDARTKTEYGPFRAFVRYELTGETGFYRSEITASNTNLSSSLDKAFIQFMHFTVGRNQSFFDFYADALNFNTGIMYGLGSDYGTANLVAYSAKMNKNLIATLSLEDRNQRNLSVSASNFYPVAYYRPKGQRFPDVVGALSFEEAWFTTQFSGALHYLDPLMPVGATQTPNSKAGFALQLGARLNADKISAGDALWLQGAYASGALKYLGIGGDLTIGTSVAPMTDAIIENNKMTLTTGYSAVAAYQHQWASNIRQALFGNYTIVDYKGRFAPLAVAKTRITTFGTNITWSPVTDFDIGVEVLYSKFTRGKRMLTAAEDGLSSPHRTWVALRAQKSF